MTIFAILFGALAWRRFDAALFLLFLLLPTYLIRFSVGSIPSTMLEVALLVFIVVTVGKEVRSKNYGLRNLAQKFIKTNKLLVIGSLLFLTGATISVFTSLDTRAALGEWKAFYIEPVLLALVLITLSFPPTRGSRRGSEVQTSTIALPLLILGLITSLFAILQQFTGWYIPEAFPGRVTAWYGFPNAVGLFLAPLIPLALWYIFDSQKHNLKFEIQNSKFFVSLLFLITSPLAIIFAKSTGALVGVAAGLGLLLLFYKKTRMPAIVFGVLGLVLVMTVPHLSPLKQELLLQDRSGQIRIAIWEETAELLKDRPILGAGLASYTERIEPYHQTVNGEGIEIFHHPHNLFLTMWVNLGIVGLVGFLLILVWFYKTGTQSFIFNPFDCAQDKLQSFLIASMTVVLVSGLVDSPYIKNDLSIFFWVLVALMVMQSRQRDGSYSSMGQKKMLSASK